MAGDRSWPTRAPRSSTLVRLVSDREVLVSREGLSVRAVTPEEGDKLLRIVRRSSGSVVTWRRAQMVLLSVQGMDVPGIAKVTFTSPDRVRGDINNFNADGFDSLYPVMPAGDRRRSACRNVNRSRR
jgi:hypothetical protein